MSKHASASVIGAFVITAFVLVLAAVMILGGGRYFRDTARVIVYFDGTVVGLRIGAPVKFRGIEIGSVKDLRINMTGAITDPLHIRIPVLLDLDEDRLTAQGVTGIDFDDRVAVQRLGELGLRAQLASESFVTGVRYVALDIKPDTPRRLVNDRRYPEIPSLPDTRAEIPDRLNEVLANLAEVDFVGLAESMKSTVEHADHLLTSPDLGRAIAGLDEITTHLDRTVQGLTPVVEELRGVASGTGRMVAPAGWLSNRIDTTLHEVQLAARSLRRLTDQLSRDPGSILRGGKQ